MEIETGPMSALHGAPEQLRMGSLERSSLALRDMSLRGHLCMSVLAGGPRGTLWSQQTGHGLVRTLLPPPCVPGWPIPNLAS